MAVCRPAVIFISAMISSRKRTGLRAVLSARLTLLLFLLGTAVGCSDSNEPESLEGHLILSERGRDTFGLDVDTLPELHPSMLATAALSSAEVAARDAGFDPFCTRFFAASDVTVVMFRMSCMPAGVFGTDNTMAVSLYGRDEELVLGPIVDWRPLVLEVQPQWQLPIDSLRATALETQLRGIE